MNGTLAFTLGRAAFSVSKKPYKVRVNGQQIGELSQQNRRFTADFPTGSYTVEIISNNGVAKQEVVLGINQLQTITVKPNYVYDAVRGLLIGIVITAVVFQLAMAQQGKMTWLAIAGMLFLTFQRKLLGKSFNISVAKLA